MDSYSTTTVGLMPRLLTPATALWALPFGAYLILLSGRIFTIRIATQTLLGDHIEAPPSPPPTGKTEMSGGANKTDVEVKKNPAENPDQLYLATRCMANYLDTVPIAMIFSLIAELNGADHKVLSCALGAFFAIKIIHIEFGLRCAGTMGIGRPIGYLSGLAWLASMASYCVYLSKDYWLA